MAPARLGLHVAANEEATRVRPRSYAYARGRSAYFRNHLTSERRAYFRLAASFRNFASKPCIFSHTIPVRKKQSNTVVVRGGALQRPPPAVYQLQEYAFNSPNIPNLDVTYGFIL